MARMIAYRIKEETFGGLDRETISRRALTGASMSP
jgi:hypothetical protein